MTHDDVMRLSGRELDAAVAELVFRTSVEWYDETPWMNVGGEAYLAEYQPIPRYSTDIVAAWEVVQHLATPDEAITITYVKGDWVVAVGSAEVVASSKRAPEAICHAALLSALKRSVEKNGGGEA